MIQNTSGNVLGIVRIDVLARVVTVIFLFSLVIDGPLRYVLSQVHLYPLVYLPKFLLLLMIPLLIIYGERISKTSLLVFIILFLSLVWGFINLGSLKQPAFGIWVLVPLLYGILVSPYILKDPESNRRLFLWLFVLVIMGVFINVFMHFPWIGQKVKLDGHEIETSRQWASFGINRHAGFSRASFNAASQILIFSIWLITYQHKRAYSLIIWILAGLGIALTTTKGVLAAYVLLTGYFLSGSVMAHGKRWRQLWAVLMAVILVSLIFLPLSTLFIKYDPSFHSFGTRFLFASLGDRLTWMWPDSFGLLNGGWHWLTGRGLGGIGAAQQYFEPSRYLAADNLFVYMTVDLGVLVSLFLLVAFAFRVCRQYLSSSVIPVIYPFVLFILCYGIVVNALEEPLLAFTLGMTIAGLTGIRDSR